MGFEEVSGKRGIQKVSLNIQKLYPDPKEREEFKDRLCQFLDSDGDNRKIINLEGELLIYLTECIIPNKRDKLIPLLLLLGNPASHSVRSEMFFSYEGKGRDHRFWKALKKAGILEFTKESSYAKDSAERNKSRKNELYELSYKSDSRIGLATFYSMPSGASGSEWAGVQGLRKLFRMKALKKILEEEKTRIERLIQKFLFPKGAVFAFQRDAYLGIKSPESPEYSLNEAKAGKLHGFCLRDDSNIRLFCLPPTRLIQGTKTLDLLRKFARY